MTPEEIAELTHSQCLARMEELAAESARLAEKSELSRSDENYIAQLDSEFQLIDGRRARLEVEARSDRMAKVRDAVAGKGDIRFEGQRPDDAARVATGARSAGFAGLASSRHDYDADPILEPDSVEARRFRNPWDLSEVRTFGREPASVSAELRSRALSAVEQMQGANDNIRQAATQLLERWDDADARLSQLALATSSPEYLRAWSKLAMDPARAVLTPDEQRAMENAQSLQRAMSLTDAAGGYLVPFQLDPTIILTSDGSYNEIRRIARQVVATGDVWNGVSAGAVQWSFDAEAAEMSDDTPTFGGPAITIRTARGFVPVSLEASMDINNATQEIGRLLAQGKDDLEARVFVTGAAGNNEPIGIITALTGVSASTVASTTADTYALNDLYKVLGALPARYRSRASWLANNLFYNMTRQAAPEGSGVWTDLAGDRPPALIGKPTYEAEAMDGTVNATQDNLVAVAGDFSNYVIADRIGMTVDFIPHLFGANGRPTFQRAWAAYYRVGADSVNDAAFRVYNIT